MENWASPGRQLGGGEGPGAVRCHRHKGLCQGEDTAEHGMPVLIGQDTGEENELPAGVEALQGGGKGVHALGVVAAVHDEVGGAAGPAPGGPGHWAAASPRAAASSGMVQPASRSACTTSRAVMALESW